MLEIFCLLWPSWRKGNKMHRGKRFRDVEFQQSQVGSSSAQSMRSQQPQQHESESQHEFQSQQHPGQEVMDDLHIQDEQGRVRLTGVPLEHGMCGSFVRIRRWSSNATN
ncbi:uncharacterized protein LOC120104156 isoform X2 [Phoenix dactylifera]|uniref:Uncharacterized protein LOC120104156 isoform X2 n=1 Tax=Phoenix dactylifera TaxID=42345 RepID=A0A8B8Z975_PHODC|nr:uncharacterized protein LOC120104156 isoform X2 [Phoenix dactylifera]